jgi:hypothetical protein
MHPIRSWAATLGEEPLKCMVDGHLARYETEVAPRQVGGGWLEYGTRFPEDFEGAGVVAGLHKVSWHTLGESGDELAIDEFRFP